MRDKFGIEIVVGDEIVYAVRVGNYADLKFTIVNDVEPDFIRCRSEGGEGRPIKLTKGNNIAVLRRHGPRS